MDTAPQDRRTYPCPDCGTMSGVQRCDDCGRGPDPLIGALNEIDDQLIVRGAESERLRTELNTVTRQIESLRRRRASVAGELTVRRQAALAARKSAPAETATVAPGIRPATVPAQAEPPPVESLPPAPPPTRPHPGPRPSPRPVASPRTPEASARSVQNVLLSLGGVLSAAAIIVFTAVAWATFGAWGRAGILTVITIALMIAPLWIAKRGLAATAETVAGLAILMVPCDAVALYLLRLFPSAGAEPIVAEPATREFGGTIGTALTTGVHTPGIAIGLLVITGIAIGYRMLTRMIVPGFAVAGLGALTLVIAVVQYKTALGTGVLVSAAVAQAFAARLFGRHPTRRGRTAGKVLVHTCGALAVVLLLSAVGFGTGRVAPAYTLLAIAAAAALLLAATQRLPLTWRGGPMWTVKVVLAGAGLTAIGLGLAVVGRWLLLPLPPWRADLDVPGWPTDGDHPFGWRLTATVVILTVVAAALLPQRDRIGGSPRWATGSPPGAGSAGRQAPHADATIGGEAARVAPSGADGAPAATDAAASAVPQWQVRRLVLALSGGVLALLTVPPALGLSWRAGALLLTATALAIVGGSLAVRDRRLSTPLLLSAIPVGLDAIVLSAGGAGTMLTVLVALFGCLTLLSALACWRGRFAHGGALAGAAGWTVLAALAIAWHLLGLAPAHIAALAGILAAVAAVTIAFALTRASTTAYRVFTSWTLLGVAGGIATVSIAALWLVLVAAGPLFVALSAVAAVPLYLIAGASLETTVDLRGRRDGADADRLRRARRTATGLATIALLLALGAYVSMWTPADTLPGYVILALVAASIAKVLPRRLGEGPAWGSWTVAATACGFAALAAVSTIPALFELTPPLLWLDWRTPNLFFVVAAASLVLLPAAARRWSTVTAATLGLLCVPVAWPTPWWAGPVLFVVIGVAYAAWAVYAPSPDSKRKPRPYAPPDTATSGQADTTATRHGREFVAGTAETAAAAEPDTATAAVSGHGDPTTTAEPTRHGREFARGTAETAAAAEPGRRPVTEPVPTVGPDTAATTPRAAASATGHRDPTARPTPSASGRTRSTADRQRAALAAQWTRGLLALAFTGYGLTAAALHPAAPDRPAGYGLAAALAAVLALVCAAIAVEAYRRQRTVGGIAVATGLVLLPGSVVLAGLSLRLPAEPIQLGAMAAACLGLLIAAALRFAAPRYLPWATLVVPPVAVVCARAGLPTHQSGMYVAVAGLVGVGAAMLMLPNRRAAAIRTGLSSIAIVVTLVKVLPLSLATLALPYRWITAAWTETPLTTVAGLTPGGHAPSFLAEATGWDLAILAVCVTTIALAILGLTGRGWGIGATFVAVAVALPTVPVVFDLPWPSLPFVALAIAVAAYVLSTHVKLAASQLSILGVVAVICCGTGLTGSLASRGATLTALTVLSIGTVTGGLLGASPARRATGWLLSAVTVTGLVVATGFAADLPPHRLPFGIIAVAAGFLALASARTPLTGPATWAAEAAGHLVAITGITAAAAVTATTAATVSTPAIVLVIYGALLGLLAVRATPDDDDDRLLTSKRWYTAGSITAAFAAYWLLLADAKVSVIEVYTVPFALATLLAGWLELRRRPRLRSWTAYGPGLCLLLLPPLAQILLTEDEPLRRLGLGVASITILLLGTKQRFQAPVVVATAMLVVQAGYEITLLWTLVPSWLPLAIGGVLLLTLGATFEKRRRDLRRLKGAIADMR